jgi:Na+/H+ antiporter NhaD/arsenite permease-like protein
MQPVGIALFALAYLLISLRRLGWLGLDRPAGALVGAVLFVASGIVTPRQAIDAVDGATILLLFAVMGAGAFLAIDGFFESAERWVLARVRTPAGLLAAVIWGAGLLAALVTNDAVCVLGTPFVLRVVARMKARPLPFLLALATAANTGSVATLVGNPQNMLCASLGGLAYREHLALLLPVAIVGLAINHAIVRAVFASELAAPPVEPTAGLEASPDAAAGGGGAGGFSRRALVTLGVVGLTVVAYTLGTDLPWTAAGALVLLFLVHRRDAREIWPRIDWSLLIFFGGLFVVVRGLEASGGPAWLFERVPLSSLTSEDDPLGSWGRVALLFLFGSNLVSNVPFILVVREQMSTLPDARLGWEMLAMASTFAGNLTLLGSAANVIVAEGARDVGGFSFLEYLKVGAPVALATTVVGVLWLVWVAS